MIAYPLSALVGQDDLVEALLVCAVNPSVGGVLVRGERGTAKSTAVRALAPMLPPVGAAGEPADAPLVEVPLGASLDRLVGSLDIRAALDGRHRVEAGLLARADGGVLYVDEVNLLGDHLVDALLDAAAAGRVVVERDGASVVQPARFLLVGTMNPEEGELRPQLLDRFGLGVDVRGPRDPSVRAEIVRRRMSFDADPAAFSEQWAHAELAIAARLAAARERLAAVHLSDAMLERITTVCARLDLDGVRGDLVCAHAARALAALDGDDAVQATHVERAAHLALRHRLRRDPLAPPPAPGGGEPAIDDALQDAAADEPSAPSDASSSGDPAAEASQPGMPSETPEPGPLTDGPAHGAPQPEPSARAQADHDAPAWRPSDELAPPPASATQAPSAPAAPPAAAAARAVPSRIPDDAFTLRGRAARGGLAVVDGRPAIDDEPVAAFPTILAALRGDRRPHAAVTGGRRGVDVLLVVDASGSMAARQRLARVKGALEAALRVSYARRDRVAVVAFAGAGARTIVTHGMPLEQAAAALDALPAGGRTPLTAGLDHAAMLLRAPRADRGRLVLLLTDGRAADTEGRAARALMQLASRADRTVVVDLEEGVVRLGLAAQLAARASTDLTRLIAPCGAHRKAA